MKSLKEWIAWADRCSTVSVVEISPKQCGELRDTLTSLLMEMELMAHVVTHPVPSENTESWRHALNYPPPPAVKKTPCAACHGGLAKVCGRCRGSGVE